MRCIARIFLLTFISSVSLMLLLLASICLFLTSFYPFDSFFYFPSKKVINNSPRENRVYDICGAIIMKQNSKRTLQAILEHKDYFDQRLVDIVNELKEENQVLSQLTTEKNLQIAKLKQKIVSLDAKNADLLSLNKTYQLKKKEDEMTVEELMKEFQRMQAELEKIHKKNEEALKEIGKLEKENKKQEEINKKLNKIIQKLKGSNSTNSNMPSSYDVCSHTVEKSKKNINSRKTTNLKRGGQKGHTAHISKLHSNADEVRNVYVKKAPSGAEAVKDENGNLLYYRTQKIDFLMKERRIETRYYITLDGKELSADEMKCYKINPVVYSANFKSTMIYLNQRGTIPYERLCEMIAEITEDQIQLKPSTLVKWNQEFSQKCEQATSQTLEQLKQQKVLHVDETGIKINGEQYWMHTIVGTRGIYYQMTKQRGDKENGPLKLLEDYMYTLVHDHFKAYYKLLLCRHAECNAHVERYLQEGIDFDKSEACKAVKEILQKSLHRKHELQANGLEAMEEKEYAEIKSELLGIMEQELERYSAEHPEIKKKNEAGYIKLFRRMRAYIDEHLLFLRDFSVPYTNNAAERSCRKIKMKKNVSHQFVSEEGAVSYAKAMTIIETSRMNGKNAIKEIEKIMA